MTFAIVNERLKPRMFLCGTVNLALGEGLAISPIIFNAMTFETVTDAKSVTDQMVESWGKQWEITEILGGGGNVGEGDFEF